MDPATAQQAPVAAAVDEGLRRQSERDRAQQAALVPQSDVLRPTPAAANLPDLPDESPCFEIKEIAFAGPRSRLTQQLEAAAAPFLNRCIGAQGVARIAAYLDARLVEQGKVTSRVALASQNVAAGRLEFRLHVGRIASIRMVDADQPDDPLTRTADERWGNWRNAFPTAAGELLDARDLEQGVEQMKRLPSQSVATTLSPGDEPDTTIVTILRRTGGLRERLHGGLTLDNSGSPSLGRTQLSASLALDNPLGLNDLLSLALNSNLENPRPDHRTQSLNLNYSLPWGYATLSASLGQSRFAQNVLLPSLTHLSSGTSHTAEVRLDLTALRTAAAKAGVYASLATRRSSSYLDDTELTTQRRKTTFLEVGLNFRKLLESGASVDAQVGYRHGVSWLNAQADIADSAEDPASAPTTRPHIWALAATAVVPFTFTAAGVEPARPWQYSLTVRGQHSGRRMLSVDQIAIGNRASVRGFDGDTVLIAESGGYLRQELSTPLPLAALQASVYVGLDIGRVWGASAELLPGHRLGGAVLGWRGQFQTLQVDAALGTPISKPSGLRSQALTAYLSATCAF